MFTLMLSTFIQVGSPSFQVDPPSSCPKVTTCCALSDDRQAGPCCLAPVQQKVPCR